MLIRRVDHPIVCVRNRSEWQPLLDRVLDLRPSREREGDAWGFSNLEVNVGDGFLGVVEPAGAESQLHRFLAGHGEGLYALAVDVGDIQQAAAFFDARKVPYRVARRGEQAALLWVGPNVAHGVLYQISPGVPPAQGTNPHYLGISEVVIAVHDLAKATATYRHLFDFDAPAGSSSDRLGYRGAALAASEAGDALVLAESTDPGGPVGQHLTAKGEGLFQFTIDVGDWAAEVDRLSRSGVPAVLGEARDGRRLAWIAPDALRGLRVELREAR
jgi:hypothetical protein